MQERFYFELAIAQARARDLERACETAEKIKSTAWLKPDAYRAVASVYARNGDFENGLRTLQLITDACNWCTNYLLSELAKGEFERADTAHAIETAYQISDSWLRHQTLLSLAARMANLKRWQQAKMCIDRVIAEASQDTDPYEASIMLGQAARVLTGLNDNDAAGLCFSNAVEKTQEINGQYAEQNRATALGAIATNQAAVGRLNDAFKTLGLARKDAPESAIGDIERATCAISLIVGEKGEFVQAISAARQISHYKQYHDDALLGLAQIQASTHRFRDALATAELIEVLSRRAEAKLAIAAAYGRAGDRDAAAALAKVVTLMPNQEALSLDAQPFDFCNSKTWGVLYEVKPYFTMGSYHRTLEQAGELAAVATELNAVLNTVPQSQVLTSLSRFPREVAVAAARAQGRSGAANDIRQWARDFQNDEVRPWLLVALANGLMDARGFPEVKK